MAYNKRKTIVKPEPLVQCYVCPKNFMNRGLIFVEEAQLTLE